MYFDFVRDQSDEGFYFNFHYINRLVSCIQVGEKIDESEDDASPIFRLNIFNTQYAFITD